MCLGRAAFVGGEDGGEDVDASNRPQRLDARQEVRPACGVSCGAVVLDDTAIVTKDEVHHCNRLQDTKRLSEFGNSRYKNRN